MRDIGIILNKVIEEKTEEIKQQDDAQKNKNQETTTTITVSIYSSLQTLF
jgi:hypothetical protein